MNKKLSVREREKIRTVLNISERQMIKLLKHGMSPDMLRMKYVKRLQAIKESKERALEHERNNQN
jgi:hypothetical protein